MAYHNYDDRPRYSSRRYEPKSPRSRDFDDVTGHQYHYSPDLRRTEYYAADQRRTYDDRYADDYPYGYAYDVRDRYPPTPPPTASYRIERRRRPSWPPFPTVEDAEVAHAKELGHAVSHGQRGDEVPNRGAIDQEPILVEVEEEMARFNQERRFVIVPGIGDVPEKRTDDVQSRKSMRQPPDRQWAPPLQTDLRDPPADTTRYNKTTATPKDRYSNESYLSPNSAISPTSFDPVFRERSGPGQTKSRPAPLQTESLFPTDSRRDNVVSDGSDLSGDESLKLRTRRKPARYSFSPANLRKEDLRTSLHDLTSPAERVSSPYSYAPADLKKDDLRPPLSAPMPSQDRIPSPYSYTPSDTKDSARQPAPLDSEPIRERVSAPYSFNPGDVKEDVRSVPRDPVRDRLPATRSVPPPGRPATPPTSTPRSTPKGSGSSAGDPSSSQFLPNDLPWGRPRPSRQGTMETLYGNADVRDSPKSSKSSSRPASPRLRENKLPPSPPRSPRLRPFDSEGQIRRDAGPRSASFHSRPTSPLANNQNFRPPSPRIEVNNGRPERYSTYPPVGTPKDRSRPPSRQSRYESAGADDFGPYLREPPPRIDIQSPSPARAPASKSTTSLPYPVDGSPTVMMPLEQSYQYFPESPRSPKRTISDYQRGPAVVPIPSHVREDMDAARSPLRRTLSEGSVQKNGADPRLAPVPVREGELVRETVPEMPELPLPPCPRSNYSSGYADWYTLDSAPSFDICPDCLDKIIGRSMFRKQFARAPPSDVAKRCHFSSGWYRLAWLMTLKEKRRDLDLIFSLASITDTELPCPGDHEAVRAWYSILNKRGDGFISNLYICERDLLYLEALMPTLRGHFQRVDSSTARLCSFRLTSRRFPQYLDTLLDIHERAIRSRSSKPDLSPFVELASDHAWKRECPRDATFLNGMWHTLTGLPELTICEECYDAVVYPEVKRGSRLADDVTHSLGFVQNEAEFAGQGNSCQLYSPRMRRVWARAVQDDDAAYLARKVRERRRLQRELDIQHRSLRRMLEDAMREREEGYSYGSGAVGGALEPERIRDALEKVQMEWRDLE